MKEHLSETLTSRTFIGLLLAQFTATFNDQAIHMVAVFYAVDMLVRYARVPVIDDKKVVALVTACFILPFFLFSSFAGTLGDRFSKRSVIVFWKVAEVGMMTLALLGLSLPHLVTPSPGLAIWSAALVVATVFLMGLHSTFFVPAKLGAMPEILHPSILSRGNGLLEGTSFTAQILGTSFGGILYALLKGEIAGGQLVPGREYLIGCLLLGLALLGTCTAFLMRRIPAAAPDTPLSWNWWKPLKHNLSILWGSKPLMLSVTGIAFCVFMTLFLRQTLLYQGELKKELENAQALMVQSQGLSSEYQPTGVDRLLVQVLPASLEKAIQEPELRVALLFALVGLGVGLGSVVAGFVSGHRVELGLVPLGALLIILGALLPAIPGKHPHMFVTCLFVIGFGAGFYLVPLYTLLQHRAPKESKGNVIAASNFLNVVGGIVSVVLWLGLGVVFDRLLGANLTEADVLTHPELAIQYVAELDMQMNIPRALFFTTSLLTALAMLALILKLPDFILRSAIWVRKWGHNRLETVRLENMPIDGPVLLLTNCDSFPAALDLMAAVDRYARVILVEDPERSRGSSHLRRLAKRAGLVTVNGKPNDPTWDKALQAGLDSLSRSDMVALTISDGDDRQTSRLIDRWREASPGTVVLPVFCSSAGGDNALAGRPPTVIFGAPLASVGDLPSARREVGSLAGRVDE